MLIMLPFRKKKRKEKKTNKKLYKPLFGDSDFWVLSYFILFFSFEQYRNGQIEHVRVMKMSSLSIKLNFRSILEGFSRNIGQKNVRANYKVWKKV